MNLYSVPSDQQNSLLVLCVLGRRPFPVPDPSEHANAIGGSRGAGAGDGGVHFRHMLLPSLFWIRLGCGPIGTCVVSPPPLD